jgi:hypothetical protein
MGASHGYENFELYPPRGVPISVAEHNVKALTHGFDAKDQLGHLAYDYAYGFIGVTLPDGELVAPTQSSRQFAARHARSEKTREGNGLVGVRR